MRVTDPADNRLILGDPPLRNAIRIAGLIALVATVVPEAHLGADGTQLERLLLMMVVVAAWIGWLAARAGDRQVTTGVALVCLGAAGGALAPIAPAAIAFSAVAGVGAAMAFDLPVAVMFGAAGPVAHLLAAAAYGHSFIPVAGSAAAALGGLVIGTSRRQVLEHADQRAQVAVERERASVEHERAELLAERNRLAREIHDVLAHTLGALSVQLEALNSGIGTGDDEQLHEGLRQTRRLVTEGLSEARRAVSALRDDAAPLPQQLKDLCAESGAQLSVTGAARPLTPHVALALYRIAQEALTNATKHAPGAPVSVELAFSPGAVHIVIVNAEPMGPPRGHRQQWRLRTPGHAGAGAAPWRRARRRPVSAGVAGRGEVAGMKIVIADDQRVVREGLSTIVSSLPDFDVVGLAANGAEAVDLVDRHQPDVVLMDLRMPEMDGIEATASIRARFPGTRVVVLTTYADDESVVAALSGRRARLPDQGRRAR